MPVRGVGQIQIWSYSVDYSVLLVKVAFLMLPSDLHRTLQGCQCSVYKFPENAFIPLTCVDKVSTSFLIKRGGCKFGTDSMDQMDKWIRGYHSWLHFPDSYACRRRSLCATQRNFVPALNILLEQGKVPYFLQCLLPSKCIRPRIVSTILPYISHYSICPRKEFAVWLVMLVHMNDKHTKEACML